PPRVHRRTAALAPRAAGDDQSASGTATDNAGNSTSTTVSGINIDKTAPTTSAAPTPSPNAAGWYKSDVTVHFSCADTLSGIQSCAADATLAEGNGQSSSGTATDKAGNSASTTVSGINIDKTAPTLNRPGTTPPNAASTSHA